MANPYGMDDDEARDYEAFLERARQEMVPKLRDSTIGVSICPVDPTSLDMKFAIELGCMIMLDKPIIAVVRPGTKVPERLVRVSDEIVEVDLSDSKRALPAIQQAVNRITERLGL